jgi:hypothetical protein
MMRLVKAKDCLGERRILFASYCVAGKKEAQGVMTAEERGRPPSRRQRKQGWRGRGRRSQHSAVKFRDPSLSLPGNPPYCLTCSTELRKISEVMGIYPAVPLPGQTVTKMGCVKQSPRWDMSRGEVNLTYSSTQCFSEMHDQDNKLTITTMDPRPNQSPENKTPGKESPQAL